MLNAEPDQEEDYLFSLHGRNMTYEGLVFELSEPENRKQ